jgi:hypothetical protein
MAKNLTNVAIWHKNGGKMPLAKNGSVQRKGLARGKFRRQKHGITADLCTCLAR